MDKIFIVESTHTHNKVRMHLLGAIRNAHRMLICSMHIPRIVQNLRKPLLWDQVKSQPRFRRFSEKIVHIVVDDVDVLAGERQTPWGLELLQVRNLGNTTPRT